MTWRRRLGLVVAAAAMGLTAFAASQGIAQAAINSDEAPHPGNSSPNDAHTFILRKSSNFGKNPDVQLVAYYPKSIDNTQWNNAYLKLRPGGRLTDPLVCQTNGGGGSDKPKYITLTMAREDGVQVNYRISYSNACKYDDPDHRNQGGENVNNQLFGRYYLPGNSRPADVNPTTNRYHVYVTIRYHDSIPENVDNTGNTAQFDVKGNTTGLKIGQLGGGEAEDDTTDGYSFPLRPDYAHVRSGSNVSSVDIPFGLPCNVVGGGLREKRIGLFDADNGAIPFQPYKVQFRVKEVGGDYLKFVNGTEKKADIRDSGYVLRPWDGEAAYASAKIKMKTQTNYVMEITGIANGNIIDVHVPGDTIYGDIDCKWEMRPDSAVNPSIQQPNGWVTFTHTATNTKAFKSDPVTSKVMWGKRGVNTTGTISTDNDRVYNPNNNTGSRTFTNSFRIPSTATDGQEYCQYLEVKPHAYDDNTAYDSWQKGDRACVKVQRPPTDARVVGVQPVVNGLMDYVEPTETARFDGYVNITGFPQLWADEWGYTEVATQRPAQRVAATSSGNELQVDGPYFTPMVQTSPGSTTYYCPHGNDTKISQSTCRHDRPSFNTKAGCEAAGYTWGGGSCKSFHDTSSSYTPPTYACPATYQQIGSQCWRYRYKCSYSSTWGAWNGSAPSCMSYWTCPGGAAGSGWGYSAPTCQGWRCQYAPYTQVNRATAPPCEYRCTNGTGVRAPQSNGWTGDMNCYIAPSFTLTCFWKNKPAFSQSVTSNGRYCDNRDMDADEAGVTIGTPVRAVLTANYPGVGAWSFPPPGYKINVTDPTWGWDNFPSRSAEDTVRVVAKPTVKVRGGDVAAGGKFKDVTTCNLAPTFSTIGGWPHSPDYDAAGTEFAATASGNVTGFATATHRGTPRSVPPYALAFANTPRPSGDQFGRQFISRMPCLYDHYGMKPDTMPSLNLNGITGAESGSYTGTGGQISNNPILQPGKRVTVYVDGNVYISNQNIRYNRSAPWTNTQDIPGFKLVVRGNIYIAPSVTELNGIYVAQPTSPTSTTTGNIYTCATATARVSTTSLYSTCGTELTVNGAFLARKVFLDRTQGTAIRGETAEYFNYLPELWLTNWDTSDTADELKYDSIISLPPVL